MGSREKSDVKNVIATDTGMKKSKKKVRKSFVMQLVRKLELRQNK